jgi:hypothetical protein
MPDAIAANTLDTIRSLVNELSTATADLGRTIEAMSVSSDDTVSPQAFVEELLVLDEQVSRFRLLLPLCTAGVQVNENGRLLSLSDLIVETRSEFDALARAQLEVLIEDASEQQ